MSEGRRNEGQEGERGTSLRTEGTRDVLGLRGGGGGGMMSGTNHRSNLPGTGSGICSAFAQHKRHPPPATFWRFIGRVRPHELMKPRKAAKGPIDVVMIE